MNPNNDHLVEESPALPQLEQLLVRAARRRATPRLARVRRRWVMAVAAASLILVGGAAAATGVVHIADGTTPHGSYSIETREVISVDAREGRQGSICLQLRFDAGRPAYGCGDRPTTTHPFGLVIADSLEGSGERVIYGLVSDEIAKIAVLHPGSGSTAAPTEAKAGLPGRFFSIAVPSDSQIALVGYDSAGTEIARVGNLSLPAEAAQSRQQAIEQGDPAGFAPTAPPSSSLTYKGRSITPAEEERMHLSCLESGGDTRCYDSPSEAEEAE
jgi:hypothetical protein